MGNNRPSSLGLVDCWFFLLWSMWPLAVALAWGVCCFRDWEVRPGSPLNQFSSKAFCKVEMTGEYMVACMKATCSFLVAECTARWALAGVGGAASGVVHSLVERSRGPVSTTWSLCRTVADVLSKMTEQSASHSCPMDSRLVSPRAGKTWAWRASWGSAGMFSSAVWVL